jgi:chorismate mutase/prephenate dehydratase
MVNTTPKPEDLSVIRPLLSRIEQLDEQLLNLLIERAEVSSHLAEKRRHNDVPEYDPEREEQSLVRLEKLLSTKATRLDRAQIRNVFREIQSACAVLSTPLRVGYLGPAGTFSHLAARSVFGVGPTYIDFSAIAPIFSAVERGQLDFGVVPFENSTEGGVTFTHDTFLTSDAKIRGEFLLDVTVCLIGHPIELSKVERVYSHPQPIAQCRGWLGQHLPHAQIVTTPSTTAAAQEAAKDPSGVALASHLAAELQGLEVLAESIQDLAINVTRFVLLAKEDAEPTGRDRTSLVFSTNDERGALLEALRVFYSAGLNLSRIESRPGREKLWEYVFFTDIEGHRSDPQVAKAIEELRNVSRMVRVLGSYPQARRSAAGAEPPR